MFHSFQCGKSVSAECYPVNCDAQEGAEELSDAKIKSLKC
jgi:hypothetical protein